MFLTLPLVLVFYPGAVCSAMCKSLYIVWNRPEVMGKKAVVLYWSRTGNTEKVALRFKSTFERNGWECDIFKIRKREEDILNPPFDINEYDFMCAGSGLMVHLPYNEILNLLRRLRLGMDPRIALRNRDETIPYLKAPLPEFIPPSRDKRVLKLLGISNQRASHISLKKGVVKRNPHTRVLCPVLASGQNCHKGFKNRKGVYHRPELLVKNTSNPGLQLWMCEGCRDKFLLRVKI